MESKISGLIYLHGFASSPSSTKARFFAERCHEKGYDILLPDLNVPNFNGMTLSSQLQLMKDLLAGEKNQARIASRNKNLVLIGSSMGGLIATLSSLFLKPVKALVLLAPAFGLERHGTAIWGKEQIENWRQEGFLDVYHHGEGKNMRLAFGFLDDLLKHRTDRLKVAVPTIVFHGDADEIIPVQESFLFSDENKEMVELHVLNDDHQLSKSLPEIWNKTERFLNNLGLFPKGKGPTSCESLGDT